jgi:hypothetical protein
MRRLLFAEDVDGDEGQAEAQGQLDKAVADAQNEPVLGGVRISDENFFRPSRVQADAEAVVKGLCGCIGGDGRLVLEDARLSLCCSGCCSLVAVDNDDPPQQAPSPASRTHLGGEGAPRVDGAEEDGHLADWGHPEEGRRRQRLCGSVCEDRSFPTAQR